jgi:hypothetical protein
LLGGVYVQGGDDGRPLFVPAPPLTDDDVQRIVETTARRVIRLFPALRDRRRGS